VLVFRLCWSRLHGLCAELADVLHAEAEACLQTAVHTYREIHVETDSQLLVQAFNGSDQDLAISGDIFIFREINYQARLNFSFFFSYCLRAGDKVVDPMAAHGAGLFGSHRFCCPDLVMDFMGPSRKKRIN
jgi:hypothetical protein